MFEYIWKHVVAAMIYVLSNSNCTKAQVSSESGSLCETRSLCETGSLGRAEV